MTTFTEDYLRFEFNDDWNVIKYDKEGFYLKKVQRLTGTKAVDFLGVNRTHEIIYLIEVKDYRIEHPPNIDLLADAISSKFRDTVAGIVGSIHTTGDAKWDIFFNQISNKNQNIHLVFLYERRRNISRDRLLPIIDKLKAKLLWLSARVFVVNLDSFSAAVPGVVVRSLPGAGQL